MSEPIVKIVVELIWKLLLWTVSLIIRGFLNEYLPVFFSKTRKELEDIISSDEIDENDKVIDSFQKKTIIKKLIVKELLIQKVQYANSKGKKKEINAVTLLSLILSIEDSFNILKVFIDDKHIDRRISKAAVYSLKNILCREGLSHKYREKIRSVLFEELNNEKHKVNAIQCLKYIPKDVTLIELLPYAMDCKSEDKDRDYVCEEVIESIEAICDEMGEVIRNIFYHYAELVLLVSENQKIVNSMIVLLQSQKNQRAVELINKTRDKGRFSEYGEKSDWVKTNAILNKTGD